MSLLSFGGPATRKKFQKILYRWLNGNSSADKLPADKSPADKSPTDKLPNTNSPADNLPPNNLPPG
jgi:hypothetical protein